MEQERGWMDELGRRLAEGDEEAFTEVVERFSRQVFALCYRVLRDTEEAKDMVQEVFTRVYLKRESFKGRASVYTWIYRIALNLCFTHLKRRKAETIPIEDVAYRLAVDADGPDSRLEELRGIVGRMIEALPPRQRMVFVLRFYEKMSFKEIAEVMKTSVGSAKASYHFAIKHLRQLVSGGENLEA